MIYGTVPDLLADTAELENKTDMELGYSTPDNDNSNNTYQIPFLLTYILSYERMPDLDNGYISFC